MPTEAHSTILGLINQQGQAPTGWCKLKIKFAPWGLIAFLDTIRVPLGRRKVEMGFGEGTNRDHCSIKSNMASHGGEKKDLIFSINF